MRGLAIVLLLSLMAHSPALASYFEERAAALGVDFRHRHFGTGEKYMPENMGSGVAMFDADGDGRLDLYFVQGAPAAANRLLLQKQDGTFIDAPGGSAAGVGGAGEGDSEGSYGMGVSFGDVDRDGDLDLFVTNFGPDRLLVNQGDGTFRASSLGGDLWSTGAGFFDPDGDGDLDLFVAHYLDFSARNHKFCGNAQAKIRAYCHPDVYDGVADSLFINDGRGSFAPAPLPPVREREAKGLGVAFADLDGDGHQDVYVANDSTMNHLYLGNGQGAFREEALLAGLGFNGAGGAEASMGVEVGDLNGDGRPEILLTHLDQETNTVYRGTEGLWSDATERSGLSAPSLPWVGFGNVLFDYDNDGDLDLFVANGHIIDNIALFDATRSHRQPAQLFENQGDGRFVERSELLGLDEPLVGRGAAAGDLDRDGDLDLVVTQNDGPARVLLNRHGQAASSLTVRLEGTESNPQGFGARLELEVAPSAETAPPAAAQGRAPRPALPPSQTLVRWMKSTSGYLSQGPPEVHFGLGALPAGAELTLTIHWPSGRVDRYENLSPAPLLTLQEGNPLTGDTLPTSAPGGPGGLHPTSQEGR